MELKPKWPDEIDKLLDIGREKGEGPALASPTLREETSKGNREETK